MQLHTPRRFTPMTRSHSSRVLSAVGAIRAMTPALLNAQSMRPNSATVRLTIAATCSSSLTSQRTASALCPLATTSSPAAFTPSSLKAASTTAAPASANARAVASPMPAAAPVTRATLPPKSSGLFMTGSPLVLLVGDVLHPLDHLAVEPLLDGDVGHRRGGRRPVPVLLARREPDHVAGP